MNATVIVAVISGVFSLSGATFAYRSSKLATRTNDRKVDLEELRDLREQYRGLIADLREDLGRLRDQLNRVQDQLGKEMDVSTALRDQVRILQRQIEDLITARDRAQRMLELSERAGGSHT